MVTNLHYDICALLLLIILLLAYGLRKIVKGRTNNIFCLLIVSIIIAIICDIFGETYTLFFDDSKPMMTVRFIVDSAYFLFRNITLPLFAVFIASLLGVYSRYKRNRGLLVIWATPFVCMIIMLFLNGFNAKLFYYDKNNAYTRGPWVNLFYLIASFYLILTVLELYINRKLIQRERLFELMLVLPLNMIAATVQLMRSDIHIDLFATTLVFIIISIGVQRPEVFVDHRAGAYNYNAFNNEMRKAMDLGEPVSLIVFKFVNHKSISSSVGFDNYTKLLKTVTEKLKKESSRLSTGSNLYFVENGTFVVSCDINNEEIVTDFGNSILRYAREPVNLGHLEVMLEPIVCYSRFPVDIVTVESLVSFISDLEMKIVNSDELVCLAKLAATKDFRMRNDMDTIIKRGIVNNGFQMYYQPIYSIKDKKFTSAEALIRLIDEEYGFVSPALFIPASEKSGAIHQIGDFVFKDVCRFIASDSYKGLGLEYIEINLSVAQCIETDLVTKFNINLIQTGVSPSQINLEITETAADYDPEITDKNINALSDMGFSFSLDDYGTGYSNIKRVVSLPLDIVKLDKTLVDEMDDPQMWIVITNTVNLLKNMNKKILVEGIEDERALNRFSELGCDYIQGYYFSKPIPEKEFVEFIKTHNEVVG